MPVTFKMIHTCIVSVHNANVLSDSHKYFTFGSHICSFTSDCLNMLCFTSHICFFKCLSLLNGIHNILHRVAIFVLSDL